MTKKSASESAFFNQRVLIGLVLFLAAVVLTLLVHGTFSSAEARPPNQAQGGNNQVNTRAWSRSLPIMYLGSFDGAATVTSTLTPTPAPCAILAYISNSDGNNVSVIDTSSNTVVATVPVLGDFPIGVGVNPAGTRAYIANFLSHNVSVIDTSSNTVVDIVDVNASPWGVAVNPTGTRVYVANWFLNNVAVIDTSDNTVIATVPVGQTPYGVAVKPDGTRAYVTNSSNNNVSVIDTSNNTVVATVQLMASPQGVAVNLAGTRAYVPNFNMVSVIDTSNNTVVATVPVGQNPLGVAVKPDGTRAYVTNFGSNNVSVIDTSNNTVVATVSVGSSPWGVAVVPDGTRAYVTNYASNNVSVFDTSSNTVVATVPVGTHPEAFGNFIAAVPCPSPTPTPTPTPPPRPCQPFRVLIVYADTPVPAQLQWQIQSQPNVATVDLFDGQNATPTLCQLQQYDIVVPLSNFTFQDADTLGNNLADYVDAGGVVVQYGFSFFGSGSPAGINGRWETDNYSPYYYSRDLVLNTPFTLGSFNAGHPLMTGVNMLSSNYANVVTPLAATEVAQMNNGNSLVAFRQVGDGHTTVGVTGYVGDTAFQSGDWAKVIVNAGYWLLNCQVGGTPTPTPSPSCTPRGWQLVANMPLDLYGAAGASDGTYFYAAGGYSFTQSPGTVNSLYRWSLDPAPNGSWTTLAPMPQAATLATAVYYAPTNKIYVFGGGDADSGVNYNITRIYDIASDTWSTGAPMPDVRALAAGGYIPAMGRIYIIGGCSTIADLTTAQPNTWAYDPVADSWTDLTGSAPFPHPAASVAYGVINNKLYIAGGRDADNQLINLTWEYDPEHNAYRQRADEPANFQNSVPGSAVAGGLLWVFGGGNPFAGAGASGSAVPSTKALFGVAKPAFPSGIVGDAQGRAFPTTSDNGRYYDPATDTWTSSPNMLAPRSFPSGGAIGDSLLIAAGGFNGFVSVASVQEETLPLGTPCPTPTPSPTPTCNPPPTVTPTPTATPTATPTPSATPRVTPTPRSRPTPIPRPTPPR